MFLLRHGQSYFNLHFNETRVDPGIEDPELTALGTEQAAAAAAQLAEVALTRIIISPYTRALQTPFSPFTEFRWISCMKFVNGPRSSAMSEVTRRYLQTDSRITSSTICRRSGGLRPLSPWKRPSRVQVHFGA
jgi:bisphosphoglycerate-dependent phosphoglycerate mutase